MEKQRKSNLFPNRKRPKNNGLENIVDFTNELASTTEMQGKTSNETIRVDEKQVLYPSKSHKGKAGRKAEYNDPRLKKDYNAKISLSTKVRIERLISRKFDGKSMGDIIDIALDNLVLNFDRDDRDSLYKSYKEDMELLKPIVEEKNMKLKEAGKPYLTITEEIDIETLSVQKELWVDRKI
ncbi:hypothetical protein A5819_003480 [Enterococcus sp. 7E2_DIV0204]|uniref:hypothetical protein n=1 Tax=unclassified Enterococcus TaxID=2608891 RepID=UPI000A343ECB|nr:MULTISPECIES: hypothetical protein [unclassified Enterococcus]OTN83930.1 hypothetical protein A5819_003480 [Enterococcus sp. 7E2_DIV0204]OTP46838.1 hypothetical protein A5884_003716 [Enterococcus sp. 7D2_DIV0200]